MDRGTAKSTAVITVALTVASVAYGAVRALVDTVYYSLLTRLLPRAFPTYNFVSQKEQYRALCDSLDVWAAVLLCFAVGALCVLFDNGRRESIIDETGGFYRIRQGSELYYRRYAADDVLAAAIAPIPMLALSVIPISEQMPRLLARALTLVCRPISAVASVLGIDAIAVALLLSYLTLSAAILTARLGIGPVALSRWRAAWLADTGEV